MHYFSFVCYDDNSIEESIKLTDSDLISEVSCISMLVKQRDLFRNYNLASDWYMSYEHISWLGKDLVSCILVGTISDYFAKLCCHILVGTVFDWFMET